LFIRKHLPTIIVLAALLLLPRSAQAEVNVVASVPTLAAIAKEVGKQHVRVTALSLHTQDPHFVDAKPSLALKLNQADLLVTVGLGLEGGWLPTLQQGARNPTIMVGGAGYLDCSVFARLLDKAASADRSHGHIHPGGNPHYLFDPRQIAHVAIGVTGRLSELDPDHAADYKANLRGLLTRLVKQRKRLERRMASHRGAPVIAYHKSWVYLAEWLGLKQVAFIEPKPGVPPNPGHVAQVLTTARRSKAKLILQENYYPDRTTRLLAQKSGASLVLLPGGVDFNSNQSLVQFVEALVDGLENGLSR